MPVTLPPALLRALDRWSVRAPLPPMLQRLVEGNPPWPMKRDIHLDVIARHPEGDAAASRRLLRKLASCPTYHRSVLAPDAKRYDLDGNVVGEITDRDRAYAAHVLARIKAAQDARKAQQAASEAPEGSNGHARAGVRTAEEPAPERGEPEREAVSETKPAPQLGPGGRPILSLRFGSAREARRTV
jgi:sRNA-binding protein